LRKQDTKSRELCSVDDAREPAEGLLQGEWAMAVVLVVMMWRYREDSQGDLAQADSQGDLAQIDAQGDLAQFLLRFVIDRSR
jgi:hypothetical protein